MEKNCSFQYAKMTNGLFRNTQIVCDKNELTIDEAKKLWNEYFPDCASGLKKVIVQKWLFGLIWKCHICIKIHYSIFLLMQKVMVLIFG